MKLNKSQRKIAGFFGCAIVFTFLFPPFVIQGYGGVSVSVGYGFFLSPPDARAVINVSTLLIEWLFVAIISTLVYVLNLENQKDFFDLTLPLKILRSLMRLIEALIFCLYRTKLTAIKVFLLAAFVGVLISAGDGDSKMGLAVGRAIFIAIFWWCFVALKMCISQIKETRNGTE